MNLREIESRQKMSEVLKLIIRDAKQDAKEFDELEEQFIDTKVIAKFQAKQNAMISGLANILNAHLRGE